MEQTKKNKRIKQWCLICVGLLIVGAATFALWPKAEQDERDEIIKAALKAHPAPAKHHGPISLGIYPDGSNAEVSWVEAVKAEDSTNGEKMYVQKRWHCRVKKTWKGWKVSGPCEISRITGEEDERP